MMPNLTTLLSIRTEYNPGNITKIGPWRQLAAAIKKGG